VIAVVDTVTLVADEVTAQPPLMVVLLRFHT
jgi:hypothetical protein